MIHLVEDEAVTLIGVRVLKESANRAKVQLDDGSIPSWVPKSQLIKRDDEFAVTEWFARREGLV